MTWIPISDAIQMVTFAAGGKDGWCELKREIRFGRVEASCRRNGQLVRLEPEWLDYLAKFAEQQEPDSLGMPSRRLPVLETDAPTDGCIWFERRTGCPPDMPTIVTGIEVDADHIERFMAGMGVPDDVGAPSYQTPKEYVDWARSEGLQLAAIAAEVDKRWPGKSDVEIGQLIPAKAGVSVSRDGARKQGQRLRGKVK